MQEFFTGFMIFDSPATNFRATQAKMESCDDQKNREASRQSETRC
jgi:hypothetical protein